MVGSSGAPSFCYRSIRSGVSMPSSPDWCQMGPSADVPVLQVPGGTRSDVLQPITDERGVDVLEQTEGEHMVGLPVHHLPEQLHAVGPRDRGVVTVDQP